jgi:hypothetical protein
VLAERNLGAGRPGGGGTEQAWLSAPVLVSRGCGSAARRNGRASATMASKKGASGFLRVMEV